MCGVGAAGGGRCRIAGDAVHAQADVVNGHGVGFEQVDAAVASLRAQRCHRGLKVVDALPNRRAGEQAQGRGRDVLVGVVGRGDHVGIADAARCGRDADLASCEFDVAHCDVGGGQQACGGAGTGAQEHAGCALGDGTGAGQHVNRATARCC